MKTKLNQTITVVAFFGLSLCATLSISWGLSQALFDQTQADNFMTKKLIIKHENTEIDFKLNNVLKLLIPKKTG